MNRIISEKEVNTYKIKDLETIIKNNEHIDKEIFKHSTYNGRSVIDSKELSEENKLKLRYYQLLLNEVFQIRQPNRNVIINHLLNVAPYLSKYNSPVIFKFDFSKFFESISIEKVLKKIEMNPQIYTRELVILSDTFSQFTKMTPGLGIINSFCELLGNEFDHKIKMKFNKKLIIYERYVDDGILIFDSPVEEEYIKESILNVAKEHFGSSISFNTEKTKYIDFSAYSASKPEEVPFDYLGYCFIYTINNSGSKFKFGIANNKIKKEKGRIREIVESFKQTLNLELLKIRIDNYYKRLVYFGATIGNNHVWQVRGISDSYKEAVKLYTLENKNFSSKVLNDETKKLLTGEVFLSIFDETFTSINDFNIQERKIINRAKNMIHNYYKNNKFISNLYKNKAIILNERIGYEKVHLKKVISIVDDSLIKDVDDYNELIKIYLKNIYYIKKK